MARSGPDPGLPQPGAGLAGERAGEVGEEEKQPHRSPGHVWLVREAAAVYKGTGGGGGSRLFVASHKSHHISNILISDEGSDVIK